MNYPSTRFVFDRKKTATKTKAALIQVEILYGKRKKYVTTGVKVYRDQWSEKSHIIKRSDMYELNEEIDLVKDRIDNYIRELKKNMESFSWEDFEVFLSQKPKEKNSETFLEYIERRIAERNDISPGTKKNHLKVKRVLAEFGGIVTFDDLTKKNILSFYEWLMSRNVEKINSDGKIIKHLMAQQTVASYMKSLKVYIHDAILHEKIDRDPSIGIKIKRGEYEQTRWLTEEEVHKIENAKLSSGSLVRVRDLFIFSCYSGLAFSDLMDFKPDKLENDGDNTYLYGKRVKTGKEYIVLILPKAQEILEKYNNNLPKYSNQQYNKRLKDLAAEAKIDKPLSSHWARITFGFMALNSGVRIEVVSKAMGHSTISETQRTYSRILKKTVVREMLTAMKKKKNKNKKDNK